jgi:hypothetical protein
MVTFWPTDVVRVKLDADTLLTVPSVPPAAGPDRALAAPLARGPLAGLLRALADALAGALPAPSLMIAYEPPPIAMAAAAAAMEVVSLREAIFVHSCHRCH